MLRTICSLLYILVCICEDYGLASLFCAYGSKADARCTHSCRKKCARIYYSSQNEEITSLLYVHIPLYTLHIYIQRHERQIATYKVNDGRIRKN